MTIIEGCRGKEVKEKLNYYIMELDQTQFLIKARSTHSCGHHPSLTCKFTTFNNMYIQIGRFVCEYSLLGNLRNVLSYQGDNGHTRWLNSHINETTNPLVQVLMINCSCIMQ